MSFPSSSIRYVTIKDTKQHWGPYSPHRTSSVPLPRFPHRIPSAANFASVASWPSAAAAASVSDVATDTTTAVAPEWLAADAI